MTRRSRCALWVFGAAATLSATATAYADVAVSGDVLPGNPSDPWNIGADTLQVGYGDFSSGQVEVTNRGTLITGDAFVAGLQNRFTTGAVLVSGYGSKWINHGTLTLGGAGSIAVHGSLLVRNGARVTTEHLTAGSGSVTSTAVVRVEGYGATLTSQGGAYIGVHQGETTFELLQGGSFFANNTYISLAMQGEVTVTAAGYGTRWINTGDFIIGTAGRANVNVGYEAQLSTLNAQIRTDEVFYGGSVSRVNVSGWGATWTNQGSLLVGSTGFGELHVGTFGTLNTEDTEMRSMAGGAFVSVRGYHATWTNSGDVTILASDSSSPSLIVDNGGAASIGGLLRTMPFFSEPYPFMGPAVRLANGSLTVAAVDAVEGDFDLAAGRLSVGSYSGDLANTQDGKLVVGEDYPATSITGSYTQGFNAKLSITVAGPTDAPLLQVDGDLNLGGRLEVHPASGSVSFQAGDSIALLGWGGALSGTFSAVNIALPLAPGLAWDTSALYTTGIITVVPAA